MPTETLTTPRIMDSDMENREAILRLEKKKESQGMLCQADWDMLQELKLK